MANSRAEFLASLLVALLLFSSRASSSDSPFMVAHKKASLTRLKSGAERISITIDLYNRGSATAYDVSLIDDSWPQDMFNLVSGDTSKSWDKLDSGAVASHSFVLESTAKGIFYGAPAVIKFRIPSRATLQEAFSTPIQPLDILADRPPEKKFEGAKKFLAKYGPLLSVLSIIGLFVYTILSPSKSSAAKSLKKKR